VLGAVFISYRRDDSAGFAGRIYDRLAGRLDAKSIFLDVDSIQPGLDFYDVLSEKLGVCDVLIAVIGKNWNSSADKGNLRRLDDLDDFVRIEIEAALQRGIRVIPVLVDGATMPKREDLPDSLQKLRRRQGIEISHNRFDSDVERLTHALSLIEEELRRRAAEAERAAREEREREDAAEAARAERARRLTEIGATHRAEEERRTREAAHAERSSPEERERQAAAEAARAQETRRLAEAEGAHRKEPRLEPAEGGARWLVVAAAGLTVITGGAGFLYMHPQAQLGAAVPADEQHASVPDIPPAPPPASAKHATADSGPVDKAAGSLEARIQIRLADAQMVKGDYVRAMNLYRQAADQGSAEAQSALGSIYRNGLVGPPDLSTAIQWYQKAAAQGNGTARIVLDELHADSEVK
jgi:hypothetical protein